MRLAFISFSRKGWELENRIAERISENGNHEVVLRKVKCRSLGEISENREISSCLSEWLNMADGIVFIGACAIAVRLISPFVNSKVYDPAVVVLDESGKFCISLLSGHIGGANELAENIANTIGAIPVITTATDIKKRFSVDLFAKKNNLQISDIKNAKYISAEIVDGHKVGMVSEFNLKGRIPEEADTDIIGKNYDIGFAVTIKNLLSVFKETLLLVPKVVTVGIGCKKGTSAERIENAVLTCLEDMNISINAVEYISSIDIKKNEKGLLAFCEKFYIPFRTFSSMELLSLEGKFSESDFVKKTTGVGSVCERSAVLCSKGVIIMPKRVLDGVTVAFAIREWSVRFED